MTWRAVGPPHAHILEEELGEEVVLYDPKQGLYVSLNGPASDIWRLATGEFSTDEVIAKIALAYGADSEKVAAHVLETINELVGKGLIPPPNSETVRQSE